MSHVSISWNETSSSGYLSNTLNFGAKIQIRFHLKIARFAGNVKYVRLFGMIFKHCVTS